MGVTSDGVASKYQRSIAWESLTGSDSDACFYAYGPSGTLVVFVHGILSSSKYCWARTRRTGRRKFYFFGPRNEEYLQSFWPEIVASDPFLEQPCIFLGGYDSSLTAGGFSLNDCVAALFDRLNTLDSSGRLPISKKAIIFVCHSQGGIVVRKLISRYDSYFRGKYIGVYLISSPSLGSWFANLLWLPARLLGFSQAVALGVGRAELDEAHNDFLALLEKQKDGLAFAALEGAEAFESHGVGNAVSPLLGAITPKVVSVRSAGNYFSIRRKIKRSDHSSICKPKNANAEVHTILQRIYNHICTRQTEITLRPTEAVKGFDLMHGAPEKVQEAIKLIQEYHRDHHPGVDLIISEK